MTNPIKLLDRVHRGTPWEELYPITNHLYKLAVHDSEWQRRLTIKHWLEQGFGEEVLTLESEDPTWATALDDFLGIPALTEIGTTKWFAKNQGKVQAKLLERTLQALANSATEITQFTGIRLRRMLETEPLIKNQKLFKETIGQYMKRWRSLLDQRPTLSQRKFNEAKTLLEKRKK